MIRFCDKEEYVIHLGEMSRSQMLLFFLRDNGERRTSIITILDEEECHYGIVTYQRVITYKSDEEVINREVLRITDFFWEDARAYFERFPTELLPVADIDGNVLGFCYSDEDWWYESVLRIRAFRHAVSIPVPFSEWQKNCRQICIMDINELAYQCYLLFRRLGYLVCVIGEKWSWFGIPAMEGFLDYPDYERFYIYAEGTGYCRNGQTIVDYAFDFLREWMDKNIEYQYQKEMESLQEKGISVCKCIVPQKQEIMITTEQENISRALHTDVHVYYKNISQYSEQARQNLCQIIGNEELNKVENGEFFQDMGWRAVDYNTAIAKAMEGVSESRRIYLLGPCIVRRGAAQAECSLAGCLQQLVAEYGYMVVTIDNSIYQFDLWEGAAQNLPIRETDVVLFIDDRSRLNHRRNDSCSYVDLKDIYNDSQRKTWMMNHNPLHINQEGHRAIAREIFDKYLKKEILKKRNTQNAHGYLQKGQLVRPEFQRKIQKYIELIKVEGMVGRKIGAVVMNCNPFTYGHQYLIAYAASRVDFLYVFIVEEDKSDFSFIDRFEMVKQGTRHVKNVAIVPSGRWVLSYQTMPLYFEKSEQKRAKLDARMDLELFARYIAPPLEITIRFVGEEPSDAVTRQYNEQMKLIMKEWNIDVEEIARKEWNGTIISASLVRKWILANDWEAVRQSVPVSTYEYIRRLSC